MRRKATQGGKMTAKELLWTVALSVFVTLYVLWRVGSRLDEQAPTPTEHGLAAERGKQNPVNARQRPSP